MKKYLFLLLLFFTNAFADYQVCFTPGGECTDMIVNAIDNAKQMVFVQAFSFTSKPIMEAIAKAKERGLVVQVILDKSDEPIVSNYFLNQHIDTYIDYVPQIAHNKVIIIDTDTVITGSFNFTYNAQYHNAENVLVIKDAALNEKYFQNFTTRQKQSRQLTTL